LTLEDCIGKALKNNLNLAVEVYGPEIADSAIVRAKEYFMPALEFSYATEKRENAPYWWIQGAGTIVTKNLDYQASLVQRIPTGGSASLSFANNKTDTNESFQIINPRFSSTLSFVFDQPLLKDFGLKVNRREILVAQNNLGISEEQLKATLVNTIFIVEEAYWNFVYAIENHKVKQQSLDLARDLLEKNKKEVAVGKLAQIEILNAEAEVASREADSVAAEGLIQRSEEVLRNIINLDADSNVRGMAIVPVDTPSFVEKPISLEEATSTAFRQRPDLIMTAKEIETNELNVDVAKNQTLPGLNLKFSFWSPGISGDRLIYLNDDFFQGIVVGKQKESASKSIKDAFNFLYKNWSVSLTLSLPLNNLLTKANLVTARLQLEQAQARLKTLEQQAALEVGDAVREIETNTKKVRAYRIARELAEKRLEAEEKKLGVGLTTNYFVLQYQEALADARTMELKALVDYNLSLARLEKACATSLESRNIRLTDFVSR
jgi:outer membrane protein TolC